MRWILLLFVGLALVFGLAQVNDSLVAASEADTARSQASQAQSAALSEQARANAEQAAATRALAEAIQAQANAPVEMARIRAEAEATRNRQLLIAVIVVGLWSLLMTGLVVAALYITRRQQAQPPSAPQFQVSRAVFMLPDRQQQQQIFLKDWRDYVSR